MQIKLKDGKVEHVENVTGRALIAAGLASEVVAEKLKLVPNLQFAARKGQVIGDFRHKPYLYFYCSTCGVKGTTDGPNTLSHEVRHCGVVEKCPPEVAKTYSAFRAGWESLLKVNRKNAAAAAAAAADLEKQKQDANRQRLIAEALQTARLAKA